MLFDQCLQNTETRLFPTLCLLLINVSNKGSLMKKLHSRGHSSLQWHLTPELEVNTHLGNTYTYSIDVLYLYVYIFLLSYLHCIYCILRSFHLSSSDAKSYYWFAYSWQRVQWVYIWIHLFKLCRCNNKLTPDVMTQQRTEKTHNTHSKCGHNLLRLMIY